MIDPMRVAAALLPANPKCRPRGFLALLTINGLLACATLSAGAAWAQGAPVEPYQEYSKVVKAAEMPGALDTGLFGETVSLYNGASEFSAVDIDLPGNNRLPVRLGRRLKIEPRGDNTESIGGFGVWDIDVPYLYGVFDATYKWNQAGNGATARCSQYWYPKVHHSATVGEIWSGNHIHLPGAGDQEILQLVSGTPVPSDGAGYHWTTREDIRFTCKPTMANGYPGEGFIAVLGDGTRITFDVGVERKAPDVDGGRLFYEARVKVMLLASRVEDAFGNWVSYSYSGHRLTSIASNDGRRIDLEYSGNDIVRATAHGRAWQYAYFHPGHGQGLNNMREAMLTGVTRPDGSAWSIQYAGGLIPPSYGGMNVNVGCPEPWMNGGSALELTIGHPSGATGAFVFDYSRHYRSGVPDTCMAQVPNWEELQNEFGFEGRTHALQIPDFFDVYSLTTRRISGPGLPTMLWAYDYGALAYGRTMGGAAVPCVGCPSSKTVTVNNPDGTKTQHIYGVRYHDNDGRSLGEKVLDATGAVVRSTSISYVTNAEMPSHPFRNIYGGTGIWGSDPTSLYIRPVKRSDVVQDGVTFSYVVNGFNTFVRPTSVTRSSTAPGNPTRTEATIYHDNLSKWVVGQASQVKCVAPTTALTRKKLLEDSIGESRATQRVREQITTMA